MPSPWTTAVLAALLLATPPVQGQSTPPSHEYRALRDGLREGRMRIVDLRTRVVAVLGEGRFALDLTAADFARSGVPDDYPVMLDAGGTRTTARFLSAEQVRIRDEYAREQRAGVPVSGEVRLVVGSSRPNDSTPVELDAWNAGQLFPLALRPGDVVTITSVQPLRKGP